MTTIGLISPGAMGASVGAAAVSAGNRVLWASDGRSAATRERAERAGLADCGTIGEMAKDAPVILSVCPPHDAEATAGAVLDAGFSGLFVEGNAIAPQKVRRISSQLAGGGITTVDGGIVGGPAWTTQSGTVLYLSGARAGEVAALFADSPLGAQVIDGKVGSASAMKMAFAAWTKGSAALLTAILGVAEKEGVRETLEKQWGDKFTTQTHGRVTASSAKAWRFAGEMREIAATFASAGFPCGFHEGAAEVFERLAPFKDNPAENLESLLQALDGER